MARRNRKRGELAFYRCWMPQPVPLAVRVEERFQTGKGLVGLDQHQVRRWRSWYRWTTLAMLAHAFLVVTALTDRTRHHRADRADLQRGPAPVHRAARPSRR